MTIHHKFEEFLISKGYEPFKKNAKTGEYTRVTDTDIISTMSNICFFYFKPNVIEPFIIGLHEKNKPITLISPRPTIVVVRGGQTLTEQDDDAMNIVFDNFDCATIFDYALNRSSQRLIITL